MAIKIAQVQAASWYVPCTRRSVSGRLDWTVEEAKPEAIHVANLSLSLGNSTLQQFHVKLWHSMRAVSSSNFAGTFESCVCQLVEAGALDGVTPGAI